MSKQFTRQYPVTSSLSFKVTDILRSSSGQNRSFYIQDAWAPDVDQDDLILLSPLSGVVKLIKTGTNILVIGNLATVLELPCTRCLEALPVPVTVELEETFWPTIDLTTGLKVDYALDEEVDDATLIDEHYIINLTEVVRQTLYICQPTQVTCEEIQQLPCDEFDIDEQIKFFTKEGQNGSEAAIDHRWDGLLALKDKME